MPTTESEIIEIAEDIHALVNDKITYKRDSENFKLPDYWKSFYAEISVGQQKSGDCDNYGMSKYVGCLERGVPPERVNLATCCVEPFTDSLGHHHTSLSSRYHMVCVVRADGNDLVLDNRYPAVWKLGQLKNYVWFLPEGDPYRHWFMMLNAQVVRDLRKATDSALISLNTMPWKITEPEEGS